MAYIIVNSRRLSSDLLERTEGLDALLSTQTQKAGSDIPGEICDYVLSINCPDGASCVKLHVCDTMRSCGSCDRMSSGMATVCGAGHYLCKACLDHLANFTLVVGVGSHHSVACPSMNCGAPVAIADLAHPEMGTELKEKVFDALRYPGRLEILSAVEKDVARVKEETAELLPDAHRPAARKHCRAETDIAGRMVQATLGGTALMCPDCNFGPMMQYKCDDMTRHDGERNRGGTTIDNSCPCCTFFAPRVEPWKLWDGEMHPHEPDGSVRALRRQCLRHATEIALGDMKALLTIIEFHVQRRPEHRLQHALEAFQEFRVRAANIGMVDQEVRRIVDVVCRWMVEDPHYEEFTSTLRNRIMLLQRRMQQQNCSSSDHLLLDRLRYELDGFSHGRVTPVLGRVRDIERRMTSFEAASRQGQ